MAKAYADWVTRSPELKGASQFINDPPALYAAGIEPVYVPTRLPLGNATALNSRTTRVKNSVDVKMTADCIECAHSYPNIGTYVLVSGDSDFIHVINSLRAIGKHVIIIGVSWSTSRRLADQVDGLILYDSDVDPEIQPEKPPAQTGRAAARSGGGNRQQLADVMRTIEEIVRAERQAGRTPLLTSLKQRIMRRVPGFDEKKLGFSGFKKLMLRTTEEGNIKLVTVGLVDWVIMADEPTPVEALPDSQVGDSAIESIAAAEEVIPNREPDAEDSVESPAGAAVEVQPEASVEDEPHTEDPAAEALSEAEVQSESQLLEPGVEATVETDSVNDEIQNDTEASGDATELVETGNEPPAPIRPELEQALAETLPQLQLPRASGDGQDGRRITDLIIMADMLEHRDGISHVAFNFLVGEICIALQQGLEVEHPEITQRWGGRIYSRTYVTRLLRELGEKEIFIRDWHLEKNEETSRTRRFRTFNLNRAHSLVKEALVSQWGPDTDTMPQESPAQEPEPVPESKPKVPRKASRESRKKTEPKAAETQPAAPESGVSAPAIVDDIGAEAVSEPGTAEETDGSGESESSESPAATPEPEAVVEE